MISLKVLSHDKRHFGLRILLCLGVLELLPTLYGQTDKAKEPPGEPSETLTVSNASSARKALVYVYRQGHMLGAVGHPVIFVNDYLLAEMHNSNYASIEVPQGTAVITATFANMGDLQIPSQAGYWASLPGCAGLDARRFFAAPPADAALCYRGVTELYTNCGVYTTTTGSYVRITTTFWPRCAPKLNGAGDALYLLNLVLSSKRLLHERLQFEVEAGKTYYVKWSVSGSGGKMKLVDAAAGAKEIKGLHIAKVAIDTRGVSIPVPLVVDPTLRQFAVSKEFMSAVISGDLGTVKKFLADTPDLVSRRDEDNSTPLNRAASFGHKDVAELLLASHADVNAKDGNSWTPLHDATALPGCGRRVEVAELLLANNADVDAKDDNGTTPLHYAAGAGCKEMVELLLANHADVNAKDNKGNTPLQLAKGHSDVAELLRQHGGHE